MNFSGRYGFTCILKHDQILFIRDRIAQLSYFRYGQVRILWPHQRLFQAFGTKKRGRWPRRPGDRLLQLNYIVNFDGMVFNWPLKAGGCS